LTTQSEFDSFCLESRAVLTRSIESSGYVSKFAGIAFVLATLVAVVASGTPPAASAVRAIEFDITSVEFQRGWGGLPIQVPRITNIGDTITFGATTVDPGFEIEFDQCRGATLLTRQSCRVTPRLAIGGPSGERTGMMRYWAATGELLGEVPLTAQTLDGLVAVAFNEGRRSEDNFVALGSENSRATVRPNGRGVFVVVQGLDGSRAAIGLVPGPGRFFADGDSYTGLATGMPTGPRLWFSGTDRECRRNGTLDVERARYTDGVLTALRATFSSYCDQDHETTVGIIAFESTPKDNGIWADGERPVELGTAMSPTPSSPVIFANLSSTATEVLTTLGDQLGDYVIEDDGCVGKPLGPYQACVIRVNPSPSSTLGPVSGRLSIRDGQDQADASFRGTRGRVLIAYRTTRLIGAIPFTTPRPSLANAGSSFTTVDSNDLFDVSISHSPVDDRFILTAGETNIRLQARSGELLSPGTYSGATPYGLGDTPTLLFADGRSSGPCGVDTSFTIHELERDADGRPSMLLATFKIRGCAMGMDGTVVYNAPAPGPILTLSTRQMVFSPEEPAQQDVWIKNVGTEPTSVSLSIADDAHNAFWFVDGTCTRSLAPGESCRQTIAMQPFGTGIGSPVGSLWVSNDGRPSPSLVTLSGGVPKSWPLGPSAPDSFDAGYWLLQIHGSVRAFGDARNLGGAKPSLLSIEIVSTPTGRGYWILDLTGEISAYGDARLFGGLTPEDRAGLEWLEFPVSMSSTPTGLGYWIFTSRGRVFAFGDAPEIGDLLDLALQGPIIDSATSPGGAGAYMLGLDGGVFALGDAEWLGSVPQVLPGTVLDQPIVGIAADPDGRGYWLVGGDGGIFAFDAPFKGSVPAILGPGDVLAAPVNGMVPYGDAYLLVASDGGAFNFSRLPFSGSLGGTGTVNVVSIAPIVVGGGIYGQ